ncbi:hypothetical protein CPB84DRAFT_1777471 [Gymnopilus junonius]|uniref:HMG box domain-containing protein n=1 Tax=Gymnopilus junonius TaxID=109634 RepID=A0A9P5TMJ3_GYMJU|nr:hypothetical protein CPB84DRAFT_1777471 [Gymnopilus junonius]
MDFIHGPNNPPRPPNSWVCFRSNYIHRNRPDEARVLSKMASRVWRSSGEELKSYWAEVAQQKLKEHQEKYPGYKYQPKKKADRLREKEQKKELRRKQREEAAALKREAKAREAKARRARRAVSSGSPADRTRISDRTPTMNSRNGKRGEARQTQPATYTEEPWGGVRQASNSTGLMAPQEAVRLIALQINGRHRPQPAANAHKQQGVVEVPSFLSRFRIIQPADQLCTVEFVDDDTASSLDDSMYLTEDEGRTSVSSGTRSESTTSMEEYAGLIVRRQRIAIADLLSPAPP